MPTDSRAHATAAQLATPEVVLSMSAIVWHGFTLCIARDSKKLAPPLGEDESAIFDYVCKSTGVKPLPFVGVHVLYYTKELTIRESHTPSQHRHYSYQLLSAEFTKGASNLGPASFTRFCSMYNLAWIHSGGEKVVFHACLIVLILALSRVTT
eukprot:5301046-Amphidinium_carterae.1